jgi:predicted nucleic acid-binding protein
MRVYLDNCCYNRPFDDQNYIRIALETAAKQHIQKLVVEGKLDLVISYMSRFENDMNPNEVTKETITAFFDNAVFFLTEENADKAVALAREIMRLGIKQKDALHLACAILTECDYFITTDDAVIRKYNRSDLLVVNPVDFVKLLEEDNDTQHRSHNEGRH